MKPLMTLTALAASAVLSTQAGAFTRILVNQVGYDTQGPKTAIVQTTDGTGIGTCWLASAPNGLFIKEILTSHFSSVKGWKNWGFQTLDFNYNKPGQYTIKCSSSVHAAKQQTFSSFAFHIQDNVLARHTLQPVISYFKASRVAGAMAKADAHIKIKGKPDHPAIDARGGWYDATGDYGVHFSQLGFTSYFNTQQVPLVVYSLARSEELLAAQHDNNYNQVVRRLTAEATYGADFLMRMHIKGKSFYFSISGPGPKKAAKNRRIVPVMTEFGIKKAPDDEQFRVPTNHQSVYQVNWRNGGGFAIAALATAARLPWSGHFSQKQYLTVAEQVFAYLQKHNKALLNDHQENIVDDYSALLAASELYRTTHHSRYRRAARRRALKLINRLSSDKNFKNYWRRGKKGSGPFYHPSDAGAPVLALLNFYPQARHALQAKIKDAVLRSLRFQLAVTHQVNNPFDYAREYTVTKNNGRQAAFFFPRDTRTAPWWQGENARIASLAAAARLAIPLYQNDTRFVQTLRLFATSQLNWILGLNPYNASMMDGVGENNPEYLFFKTWQYTERPGGIVNGITGAFDQSIGGIDYNLPISVTHGDHSWRWNEQWLPHDAWYLLAIAAHHKAAP